MKIWQENLSEKSAARKTKTISDKSKIVGAKLKIEMAEDEGLEPPSDFSRQFSRLLHYQLC